jgi:D-alanyl-D-alanine carboxypeptidase/D-alanyl-D-alanine-endopeptidase (penicillin-binding protein 4)
MIRNSIQALSSAFPEILSIHLLLWVLLGLLPAPIQSAPGKGIDSSQPRDHGSARSHWGTGGEGPNRGYLRRLKPHFRLPGREYAFPSPPSASSVAVEAGKDSFQSKVSRLINQTKYQGGFWGIQIVCLDDNRTLFSLNEKKRFLPASNMKLIIGAAALDRLGPSYRFDTSVYAQGRIDSSGRLLGDLVLMGNGDPNLEGRVYTVEEEYSPKSGTPLVIERLAEQIAGHGIKSVEGDIIGDDTAFLYEPYAPGWEHEDLQWAYGAPTSALAVNENVFRLELRPGDLVGDPALIKAIPFFTGFTLVNKIETVEKGKPLSIGIERHLEKNELVLQGEMARGHVKLDYVLAVADPAEYAAFLLKEAIEKRAIFVRGRARARHLHPLDTLEGGKPSLVRARGLQSHYLPEQKVASSQSVPLVESLKIMMKVSQNLYAEMLLRKLGAESGEVGSIESGVTAINSFLARTGTPKEELQLSDGSGMSRTDLVTTQSIIRLLTFMEKHPQRQLFLDTLPVGGLDGTLKHRMQQTAAAGLIQAKTGTSTFVNTLSGYARTKGGEKLAFSIMANNQNLSTQEVRETIDQICDLMAEYDSHTETTNKN